MSFYAVPILYPSCLYSGQAHKERRIAVREVHDGSLTLKFCKECFEWYQKKTGVPLLHISNADTEPIIPMPCSAKRQGKVRSAFSGDPKPSRKGDIDVDKLMMELENLSFDL